MADLDVPPPSFEREYGCTPAEWARWMSESVCPGQAVEALESGRVEVAVGTGRLQIAWQTLAPRTIALFRLPRLAVSFGFDGVADGERAAFMRRLDLQLQRGGG